MNFAPSERSLLSPYDLGRFAGETLFDKLGRACCEADCLPRKELFESWHVAKRVRRRLRGRRVVDLACGHGLTAFVMLLLDQSSERALAVDTTLPASADKLFAALAKVWPALVARVELREMDLESVPLRDSDLVVSCHACGLLTDRVIARAIEARAAVAVLPCCHDFEHCDLGGLSGWLEPALAIDVTRAARLRECGYTVHTQTIPASITPKNRLLLAHPQNVVTGA